MHVTRRSSLLDVVYKMLRMRTALLMLLFIAIGDAASKPDPNTYSFKLALEILAVSAWYIFSTSTNDLADEEIDKINLQGNSQRPLIHSEVSRRHLWFVAFAGAICALVLVAGISRIAVLYTLAALTLSYIYSFPPIQISRRGIFAPLLLPLGYVAYPLLLVAEVNDYPLTSSFLTLLAGLYLCFAGRIILKDFRDVEGDRKFGKQTYLVRHGVKATCLVSSVFWALGVSTLNYRFADNPITLGLLTVFFVLICIYLLELSKQTGKTMQIQYVGLIGRLSNGSALLILVCLYAEATPAKTAIFNLLLILTALFAVFSAYTFYGPLMKSGFSTKQR